MTVEARVESSLLERRLDNGLQVLGQRIPGVESASAIFWVKTGTRDETPRENGTSHFLEHMAFKRSKTRTYEDFNREFDQIGAENNAFTWLEMTAYHSRVVGDQLAKNVELLADLTRPVLDKDDFEQERNVILEEIARHRDQPYALLMDEFLQTFFPDQGLGRPTLGTPETINAMTVEDMRKYWTRRYGPDNMLFAVAGNFEWDRVIAQLEELTADWKQTNAAHDIGATPASRSVKTIADDRWHQQHFVIGVPSITQGHRHYYTAAVLANILGDDSGSRLFWSVNQTGLADQVGASIFTFADAGVLFALAVTDPDKAPKTLSVVRQELEKLQSGPIAIDELTRAKMKLLTSTVIEGESTRARMMGLVDSWLSHGRLETLEEVQAAIEAVTVDDIKDFLGEYPLTEGQVLTALGPLEHKQLV
jgi:predicted Zn-dependent peptidase